MPQQFKLMMRLAIVESVERCAWIAADQHRHRDAALLFGAAARIRESLAAPLPLGDRSLHDPRLRAAQTSLAPDAFASLWDAGQRMTIEEAVAYALGQA